MKAILAPHGNPVAWFRGASAIEITNSLSGLRIVVAAPNGEDQYLEVHFPYARAFQAMDEGDMLGYWEPGSTGSHLVFEVLSGGWLERAGPHYLHVTAAVGNTREWLVVSDDLCVSVISSYEPHVREYGSAA